MVQKTESTGKNYRGKIFPSSFFPLKSEVSHHKLKKVALPAFLLTGIIIL